MVHTVAASAAVERARWSSADRVALPTRRTAVGVVLTRLGVLIAFAVAALYRWAGSPISAAAFTGVGLTLAAITLVVPRTVPLAVTANVMTAVTAIATAVIGIRTGGPMSPMVMAAFFPPITMYLLCGRRVAIAWAALSSIELAGFVLADRLAGPLPNDLSPDAAGVQRVVVFVTCVLVVTFVILGNESVRRAEREHVERANRALDRQRILGDMHDGIGSQLLGLMIQVRARRIDDEQLLHGLTSCLDDLKLIVDSLDPAERSFELAVGELRARLTPRCEAAGVELAWSVEAPQRDPGAERTLQVLRVLQELTSNALRHSASERIDVTLRNTPAAYEVSVRDHGTGFDPDAPPRAGRGLVSLRARAARLGGTLIIARAEPGTLVTLRFPLADA